MRPIRITRQLTADPNGIAEDQTTGGAGNLVLDGVLVDANGVAQLGGTINPKDGQGGRQIVLESAGNLSAITFTITGTIAGGRVVTEDIAGPNAGTTTTVRDDWDTVTQIAVSAAVGTNVEVGVNEVGASQAIPLDQYISPFHVSLGVDITGVVDATVQFTFDDVFNSTGPHTWFNHADLTNVIADADGTYISPVSATRILNNSGAGTSILNVLQAGAQ